jgi:hypothetical protein
MKQHRKLRFQIGLKIEEELNKGNRPVLRQPVGLQEEAGLSDWGCGAVRQIVEKNILLFGIPVLTVGGFIVNKKIPGLTKLDQWH